MQEALYHRCCGLALYVLHSVAVGVFNYWCADVAVLSHQYTPRPLCGVGMWLRWLMYFVPNAALASFVDVHPLHLVQHGFIQTLKQCQRAERSVLEGPSA